ncbi:tryptophan synthase subunit alpha [Mesobacillus maritimus]|uniref:tryptophan synthase subunit alpha n=1 Tax=Mesobacillus maritimus TaxID=1643336 RepID=UPI0020408F73|nr:tryptophan synthase subunit alpha [Mesobacillus maritimus]MCM3588075.1 tryptophan synthase subunit alpha [Mesobacillus maritimus]MCM3668406.1 tryptophan synthase subunit alpha [Mesobacillus maritimus]
MSRIKNVFHELNQKAFVPYIMAGDGGLDTLKEKLLFLQDNGVDAVEIGIPFSDPVADGPTIQKAGIRALAEGVTLTNVLETIGSFRSEIRIPLIIMTYTNPVIAYGIESFAKECALVGVDGCIIPDLPLEEEELFAPHLEKNGLELIRLVTVTSPEERIRKIASKGNGYIYAVTVAGITGARAGFQAELGEFLTRVKQASHLPVLAGFGISTPEHVQEMNQYCDGVIVGSKIVDLFHEKNLEGIKELIAAAKIS